MWQWLIHFVAKDGHFCEKCSYSLSEEQCKVFDSLPQLEGTLPYDVKSTLVYTAGYVIKKKMNQMQMTRLCLNTFGDSLTAVFAILFRTLQKDSCLS